MAGAQLTVELELPEAELAALERLDPSQLTARVGEYLLESTQKRFGADEQRSPEGVPWKALQPSYAKRKKYNKDKILTLRGYLRSSIRYQQEGLDALVGTDKEYAAIHQFGDTIAVPEKRRTIRLRQVAGRLLFAKKKHKRVTERDVVIPAHQIKIPPRPYLGLSNADREAVVRIMRDWITGL
jgi:phage virion morphogenesis protein